MPEYSAHELSELRMKQAEQAAVDLKTWPKDNRAKELVFSPKEVHTSLKRDLMLRTEKVKSL